jgi:hypothetical protein
VKPWLAVLAVVLAFAVSARCAVDVKLGLDPRSDTGAPDHPDAGSDS